MLMTPRLLGAGCHTFFESSESLMGRGAINEEQVLET